MAWTMSSRREGGEIHFFIGAIRIATVVMRPEGKKWKAYLRHSGFEIEDAESVSAAMKKMHELLNSPPKEE